MRRRVVILWQAAYTGVRIFMRGVMLVIQAAPVLAIAYLVLIGGSSILPVIQVWLAKIVIDHFVTHAGLPQVLPLALSYVVLLLINAGVQPLIQELSILLEDQTLAEVDKRLIEAGSRLVDLVRIERPAFGDELRSVQDAASAAPRLFPFLQKGPGTLITLIGICILLFRLSPFIPLGLIIVSIPYLRSQYHYRKKLFEAMVRRSRSAREMEYYFRLVTSPISAKEIRLFGLGNFFHTRFQERCSDALAEVQQHRSREARSVLVWGMLYAFMLLVSFAYVAVQVGTGFLSLGDFSLYINAMIQAESKMFGLSASLNVLYEALLLLRALFSFLDSAHPQIVLVPEGKSQIAPLSLSTGVELQNVSFGYPEEMKSVLDEIHAKIPSGKVIALVGVNGAGKSTLVKLLTRMYDPDQGDILLDGVPLKMYDLFSLRSRMAAVYQDFARFALTLRQNIEVGGVEANTLSLPDEQIKKAAYHSGADAIAVKLP